MFFHRFAQGKRDNRLHRTWLDNGLKIFSVACSTGRQIVNLYRLRSDIELDILKWQPRTLFAGETATISRSIVLSRQLTERRKLRKLQTIIKWFREFYESGKVKSTCHGICHVRAIKCFASQCISQIVIAGPMFVSCLVRYVISGRFS